MKTNTLDFDAQALREKILDLAMRGKLVPQDPNDDPASVLLEKIKAEKEQLIKEKKIKKSKPLAPITDDEKPFDIPDSWEWVRLGDVITILRGGSPRPIKKYLTDDPQGINWIKIGDSKPNSKYIEYAAEKIIPEGLSKTRIVSKGDFLLSNSMSFGRPYILKINGAVHDGWLILSDYDHLFNKDYLYYLLSSGFINTQFMNLATGSTVKNLNRERVANTIAVVPPLKEQSRIAAKIAQLFALLRKVESSTQQYAKLQTLLKSKVLDLAMRGKLVEQDPHDEPASVLLERIKTEKEQLVKKGKIRKSKSLPPITEDEKLFNLPQGWTWVKLNDVLALENGAIRRGPFGSSLKKSFFVPKSEDTYKVYEQGNAINHTINYGSYYISYQKYEELQSFSIRPGDIIISGAGTIGKTYILPSNSPKGVINQALIRVRLNEQLISKEYFLFAFKQKVGLINKQAKGTAIKNMFSVTHMKNDLVWALPPLAEQKRITKKIQNILSFVK